MTGVRKKYRGKGLGISVKMKSIEYVQNQKFQYIYTHNDSNNKSMLQINQQLGFQPTHGVFWLTNEPGTISQTRASSITFLGQDDIRVCYAHVADLNVKIGDPIKAGDVIAKVGNNGYSRHPHIHIGSWKGDTPLQIRFDLKAMGNQYKELGNEMYYL